MSKHIATGTPTQVAHPWKSVVRTIVAAGVGVAVTWLLRNLGIDLTALSQPIIDTLTPTVWAVATGLAQWLLTRPRLQAFWAVVGLGTGVEKETETIAGEYIGEDSSVGYPVPAPHEPSVSPERYQPGE